MNKDFIITTSPISENWTITEYLGLIAMVSPMKYA